MKCLIVDDQKFFRTILKRFLELDSSLVLVGECENAIDAHQKIMTEQVDVVFLDIKMPDMSGLELAKILEDKKTMIIFTTSIREHAAEAFDLNVVDFLVKPISPVRFIKAIEKAKQIINTKNITLNEPMTEFVSIRDSNVVRRFKISEVLYFESTGDYVKIKMPDQSFSIHSSLKAIEPKLPAPIFLRVHRSFIINIEKIDTLEGKTLVIKKNLIPVSDAFRSELNKRMQFL